MPPGTSVQKSIGSIQFFQVAVAVTGIDFLSFAEIIPEGQSNIAVAEILVEFIYIARYICCEH